MFRKRHAQKIDHIAAKDGRRKVVGFFFPQPDGEGVDKAHAPYGSCQSASLVYCVGLTVQRLEKHLQRSRQLVVSLFPIFYLDNTSSSYPKSLLTLKSKTLSPNCDRGKKKNLEFVSRLDFLPFRPRFHRKMPRVCMCSGARVNKPTVPISLELQLEHLLSGLKTEAASAALNFLSRIAK